MKKTIILLVLLIGASGISQEKNSFKSEVLELIKLQSEGQFEVMVEPFLNMVPEENQKAFMEEVNEAMPALYEQIAEIYMNTYTQKEIQQIMDFYESPVGQKMVEVTPQITQKSMQAAQSWGMQLRPLLSKYAE